MAYRSDLQALQSRHVALAAEVAERTRARDEVGRLLADVRALEEAERQLADRTAGGPARRRRRRALIAGVITFVAVGAGGVGYRLAQPKPDRLAAVIDQFSVFTDEMCGCSNAACTQQVSDAMVKWSTSIAKEWQAAPKIDEEYTKRITELASRMGTCISKAMTPPAQATP